jgi:hypothetical protein
MPPPASEPSCTRSRRNGSGGRSAGRRLSFKWALAIVVREREITSIVWHQLGHRIEVIYAEGEPDHITGAQIVAAQLAESVGLAMVIAPPGTLRWVRNPGTWDVPPRPAP